MTRRRHYPSPTPQRVNWRVDEFCEAHAIGRTLFYSEVKRGELKTIKVGTRTLIAVEDALAWLARKQGARQ